VSWLLIHRVFTLRYAHVFYRSKQELDVDGSGGGLIFPGKGNPNYRDFAYFSFIIGMTCQVSDVSVTSHSMRLLALLHGLLSFAFNTVILALSINIISGLFVNWDVTNSARPFLIVATLSSTKGPGPCGLNRRMKGLLAVLLEALEHSLLPVRVALLIKEERGGRTVAVNIIATSEGADFSIAKETGARMKSKDLL
jgi:hypothetical protein